MRKWMLLLAAVALLAVGISLQLFPPRTPEPGAVVGVARVVDGDTLEVAGQRIRLHGIDAPELGQTCRKRGQDYPCGKEATRWLERAIARGEVRCAARDRDRYGRLVAVCHAAGRDLGEAMVRAGWALAYRRFSEAYVFAEEEARANARGLWAGSFEPPQDWRRTHDR